MGNKITTLNNKNNEEFLQAIDNLIGNFISQEEFQYYKNLSDMDECNKMFVISQDLFKKYLDNQKTSVLHKRVNTGKIVFGRDIDVVTNKVKISNFIEQIASFYTTIANIITTISLSMGLSVTQIQLKQMSTDITKYTKEDMESLATIKKMNQQYAKTLKNNNDIGYLNTMLGVPTLTPGHMISPMQNQMMQPTVSPMQNQMMQNQMMQPTLSPNINDHLNFKYQRGGKNKIDYELSPSSHSIKILSKAMNEVNFCEKETNFMNYEAIKELLRLFNNAEMNQKTLQYDGINVENDTLKTHAVARLQEAYQKTQNNDLLKKFCENKSTLPKDSLNAIKSNKKLFKLFEEYGKNLGKTTILEEQTQKKLMQIIQLIIVFPSFNNSNYSIKSDLTYDVLLKLVEKTRTILIKYFIEIETIYTECVEIYMILYEELKLLERHSMSQEQEKLFSIKDGGYHTCSSKNKKKNKTRKFKKN